MVHDFVMAFAEDTQGREAGDVVISAQIHLLGTVNLQTVNDACLSACTASQEHRLQ